MVSFLLKHRRLSTVQQCLSAIRSHAFDMGHSRRLSADEELSLTSVLKGYNNLIPELTPESRRIRIGFSSESVIAILRGIPNRRKKAVAALAKGGPSCPIARKFAEEWRQDWVLLMLYWFLLRSATLHNCSTSDISRDGRKDAVVFLETVTKTRRVVRADGRRIPLPFTHLSIGDELTAFVQLAPCHLTHASYMQWEQIPKQKNASALFTLWVQVALERVGDVPPPDCIYSSHSPRISAATHAKAIGVADFILCARGGWKSVASLGPYISGFAVPSISDWGLWGFLIPTRPNQ